MSLQVNWSVEKKRWGPRGFEIISNQLSIPGVRLVIDISINIFLVFFFYIFFVFVFNIVTGLNVSELKRMYEILG